MGETVSLFSCLTKLVSSMNRQEHSPENKKRREKKNSVPTSLSGASEPGGQAEKRKKGIQTRYTATCFLPSSSPAQAHRPGTDGRERKGGGEEDPSSASPACVFKPTASIGTNRRGGKERRGKSHKSYSDDGRPSASSFCSPASIGGGEKKPGK